MTPRTAVLVMLLAFGLLGPAAQAPSAQAGVGDPVESSACVPPVVATRARCTFDVYGSVRDAVGSLVSGAVVSDGIASETTNASGGYDLFAAFPRDHTLTVRLTSLCATTVRVSVNAAEALQEGGKRANITLPCTRPTYTAFGFGVVQQGHLIALARSGVGHSGYAGGIQVFGLDGAQRMEPAPFAAEAFDDRDAAGGLTRSGALMTFYARFDVIAKRWSSIGYVRATKQGSTFGQIPAGSNVAFSPYGPLLVLPSGTLMQTFYGSDGTTWRIYTARSTDDGRRWSRLIPIDVSPPFRASEAAAVYLDGTTDGTSRILLVARARGGKRPNRWAGLVHYLSRDGGRSWARLGLIDSTKSRFEPIPWIATLEHGRVLAVWADRGTLSLKRSIMSYADAIAGHWSKPVEIYRSAVSRAPVSDIGDFGYPSIVSYGPADSKKAVVFNDVNPAASIGTIADVDLMMLPVWAHVGQTPVTISP